jgi:hypothetical protein
MNRIRVVFILYGAFLTLVVYTADIGAEDWYWGWLKQIPMGDKFGHGGLMFMLSTLANLALRCQPLRPRRPTILMGSVIVTVVVLCEEFSQIWIPGRDFDLFDIAADLVGIGGGDVTARTLIHVTAGRGASPPECST